MEKTVLFSPHLGFWSLDHGWTRQFHQADRLPAHYPLIIGFRRTLSVHRISLKGYRYIPSQRLNATLRETLSAKQWERYMRLRGRGVKTPGARHIERAVLQCGGWFALQCEHEEGYHLLDRTQADCLQKGRGY